MFKCCICEHWYETYTNDCAVPTCDDCAGEPVLVTADDVEEDAAEARADAMRMGD